MAANIDIGGVLPFDCKGDVTSVSPRWKRWKKSFHFFVEGKGVTNVKQKKALLLHCAGIDVQEVFETLPALEDEGDIGEYEVVLKMLDDHFSPKANMPYERHIFRQMKQENGENVDQFVIRLTHQAENCNFGSQRTEQIRDQVIDKCRSSGLRRKLLERGQDLKLEDVQRIARAMEAAEIQSRKMEESKDGVLNLLRRKPKDTGSNESSRGKTCFRCGRDGHFARDSNCPARSATCNKCHKIGHFAAVCKTKADPKRSKRGNSKCDNSWKGVQVSKSINSVDEDDEYAFHINKRGTATGIGLIDVNIGGVEVGNVMIDSGSSCNIIDKSTWEALKRSGVICKSEKLTENIYPYGTTTPLKTLGKFYTKISIVDHVTEAEFIVLDGTGRSILGCSTARELGVLKLGPEVNVLTGADLKQKYAECFEGVGKLKNFQLKIHTDPAIKPVAQNPRRIPFSLRKKVEDKLDELLEKDIIEKVEGPTPWVSPVCVVPKPTGEIRLCVDMRRANEAIQRERHPIPTVDEVLLDMNQSTVFSKIDLKWGFHQIELEVESRSITTFTTHCGLFRYKRLMFGITSAPEIYQHIIQQVLKGCEGTNNIADDIIVHGPTAEVHDERLNKVMERLRERGLTLNPEKCQFRIPRITFMGHVLSEKGIGPTEEKVRAVVNAREPESAAEVRSFLGLVNFCSRFIPDLATTAEPLRKLTRAATPFVWGKEQGKSFEEVKKKMSSANALAYFDKEAETVIITDASPVGLGAVLLQEQQGVLKVVAYASRCLTDVERRYSQTEKEALSIVWACERFHVYLYGIKFKVLSDHKPLEVIYSRTHKSSARIERWVLRLQPYDFTVEYLPGPKNIADTLSRLVHDKPGSKPNVADCYIRFIAENAAPKAIPIQEIEKESAIDQELSSVRVAVQTNKLDQLPREYKTVSTELTVLGKLVLRGSRIVIPKVLRSRVLHLAHEGHQGVVKTKQRLRSKVWWPGVDGDTERRCKTCHGCQLVSQVSRPEPVKRTLLPEQAWQDVAADLLGPLPGGEYLFVVVDYYSRFFEVDILRSVLSRNIIESLDRIFAIHGFPQSIKTDNGPQFISSEFEDYLTSSDVRHLTSTPLWPQANGEVERQNRSLLKAMRIGQATGKDWRKELNKFLLAYRSTPHSITGVSPAKLLFGREIRTKIPCIQQQLNRDPVVADRDMEMKQKGKVYADQERLAEDSPIEPGDVVLVKNHKPKNKLSPTFGDELYRVMDKKGSEVTVESSDGVSYRRNSSHVKKYHSSEEQEQHQDELEKDDNVDGEVSQKGTDTELTRPRRERRPPERFDEYLLYK